MIKSSSKPRHEESGPQDDRAYGLLTGGGRRVPAPNAAVILCVDDEPISLSARLLLLSIAGYKVLGAGTGSDALWLFRGNHVDLVITDYRLPDLPGAELVCQMKHLKPETPIVLFTGVMDPEPGFEEATQVITKGSMTPPQFLDRIAAVLSQTQSGWNLEQSSMLA